MKIRRWHYGSVTTAKVAVGVGPLCASVLGHDLSPRLHGEEEETKGILGGGKNRRWRQEASRSVKQSHHDDVELIGVSTGAGRHKVEYGEAEGPFYRVIGNRI
jgi:hypothetical protein